MSCRGNICGEGAVVTWVVPNTYTTYTVTVGAGKGNLIYKIVDTGGTGKGFFSQP